MILEELVAPLWLAKKLPKDMKSVFYWHIEHADEADVRARFGGPVAPGDCPAPTMQEMEQLIGTYPLISLSKISHAFALELTYGGVTGKGWKYLDKLLFSENERNKI